MPRFYWNVQQGSLDWYKLRSGVPTSSQFHRIITPRQGKPSEARHRYAAELIAERLLHWQADPLDKIDHIAHGKENEPFAVAQLEEIHEIATQPIGFITTDDSRFGASPDRVAGVSADQQHISVVVEAKCPTVPVQMERLLFGDDDAYRCQRIGHLWVSEADKAYFISYHPRMPLYLVEQGRDEPFIEKMKDCLERFADELAALTLKADSLGVFQAFAELRTPLDAERPAPPKSETMWDDPDFVRQIVEG
jgi:hypothetical protein